MRNVKDHDFTQAPWRGPAVGDLNAGSGPHDDSELRRNASSGYPRIERHSKQSTFHEEIPVTDSGEAPIVGPLDVCKIHGVA
jgi:hypothetical protein